MKDQDKKHRDPKDILFSVTKKDLELSFFSGTGPGGQHKNKSQNCVRIHHPESGVTTTGQDERSRAQNLKNAFIRLTNHPKFQAWLKIKTAESLQDKREIERQIQKAVDEAMNEKNLKVEYYDPEDGNAD
jgi:protein subunit release factor B